MSTEGRSPHDRSERRYAVDERLVMPETRFEVIDGGVIYVSPADQPHASRHSKLNALLEACVADDHDVACDMLTRTSEKNDMAPDASVYPCAPDPETGRRQLEVLAFEIVATESLAESGRKAARMCQRGVRRVFAVDVDRGKALEWSTRTGAWEILSGDGSIADPALAVPLRVNDLVDAAKVDDALARALLAKRNPVLVEALEEREARGAAKGRAEGKAEGRAEGRADSILAILVGRKIEIDAATRARIAAMRDLRTLDRWLEVALRCASASELE
jgi:hypothetical protein